MSKPNTECIKKGCWHHVVTHHVVSHLYSRKYKAFGFGMVDEHWNGTWKFCPLCGAKAGDDNG